MIGSSRTVAVGMRHTRERTQSRARLLVVVHSATAFDGAGTAGRASTRYRRYADWRITALLIRLSLNSAPLGSVRVEPVRRSSAMRSFRS
jgi:hypothetical protein